MCCVLWVERSGISCKTGEFGVFEAGEGELMVDGVVGVEVVDKSVYTVNPLYSSGVKASSA